MDDPRPWLVGFSGGKDSTLLASLVFDAVLSVPPDQRKKPVTILCTDTGSGSFISHKRAQKTLRSLFSFTARRFRTRHSEFRIFPANRLRELQEQIAAEKGIRADALRRLLAKVDEFSESHRAFGLPNDLLSILKDDLAEHGATVRN